MSMDNFVLVSKEKRGYAVSELSASNGSAFSKEKFTTFKKAVKFASEIPAEHGIQFSEDCF